MSSITTESGVRGDMKAIIRAILEDQDARDPAMMSSTTFGKMKEPYIRTANLIRALNAHAANGVYGLSYLDDIDFQQPLSSPSVFNFFGPILSGRAAERRRPGGAGVPDTQRGHGAGGAELSL